MKTKLLGTALAFGLAAAPFAATAGGVSGGNANSDWTIYGWQNWSYELVNMDDVNAGSDRDFDRINNNAANIGFSASIDTGMSMGGQSIKANFQCEQFTYHNRLTSSGLCNRNSKISLSGAFGEIMFGQWLLPFNEMVAQWVDPFYDAGDDSHTSIMGSVGYGTLFYNGGHFFTPGGSIFDYDAFIATNAGFNRRQEEIIQYFSPNMNGFTFRIATTSRANSDSLVIDSNGNADEVDPRIWSMGVAYEKTLSSGDNVWFALTYEKHDEWSAFDAACSDSDDDAWRIAGRYIKQWGNGMFTRVSAMWETLEYEWDDCSLGTLLSGNPALGADANNLELEKDSWMISGIQNFGNGFDVRFSYMDGDEFDCDTCATDDDTDATAFNIGVYYTMPAGTELRLTYSEVDNEDNADYGFGISGTGGFDGVVGNDLDMIALGIVQWF